MGAEMRSLRWHRAVATGLLVAVAAIFVAVRLLGERDSFWFGLLEAGAEAALIGGLADWFAVTALFRHPLGLPIPHTALIPRNKDRIGRRLGRFVTANFLAPELVHERLRTLDVARRTGDWLAQPDNARRAARRIAAVVPHVLGATEDDRLRALLRKTLTAHLRAADLAPLLMQAADAVPQREIDIMVSRLIGVAREALNRNEGRIMDAVARRNAWWVPRRVDRRMARALIDGINDLLDDLLDPHTEARRDLDALLSDLGQKLRHDPDTAARLRLLKNRILRYPGVQAQFAQVWDRLKVLMVQEARTPDSRFQKALADSLQLLGRRLRDDSDLRRVVEERLEDVIGSVLVPWRQEIGAFIESVVHRWDARTMTDRLELEVGQDLQFIRINGTLVGALVGCLLYLLIAATG